MVCATQMSKFDMVTNVNDKEDKIFQTDRVSESFLIPIMQTKLAHCSTLIFVPSVDSNSSHRNN